MPKTLIESPAKFRSPAELLSFAAIVALSHFLRFATSAAATKTTFDTSCSTNGSVDSSPF